MAPSFLAALAVIGFVLVLRLLAGRMDDRRLRRYLADNGGKLLHRRWTPFGKGWLSEGIERVYAIEYQDAAGYRHRATVETSLLTGVYLTADTVVAAPPAATRAAGSRAQLPACSASVSSSSHRE